MTDSEAPPGPGGGPSWLKGGRSPAVVSPATVGTTPPTYFTGATGTQIGSSDDLFSARYSRTGTTPIPFMVVAFATIAAAWWAMDWSKLTPEATDPVKSSEWWVNITAVLVPSQWFFGGADLRVGSYSVFRMWVALGLLVLAAATVALWIGRIGNNVRSGHAPFGAFLPIVAFPAWWLLPLSVGLASDAGRSRSDQLLRFLVAFAILFAQFLLMRWPTLNRIWRAGHLKYDLASIGLWLPMMIPWVMFMTSSAFTLLAIGDDGKYSDSSWRPTAAMLDWAHWLTVASAVGLLILLVVVSVMQHLGMAKDRRDDDAGRFVPPTGPPGSRPPGMAPRATEPPPGVVAAAGMGHESADTGSALDPSS